MRVKKNVRNYFLAISVIILVSLVSVSLFVFRQKISSILTDISIRNITDIQKIYTQSLQAKFLDQLNMLEAQARYFDNTDLHDLSALKKTICTTKGIGEFKKIAIVDKEGVSTNYNGENLSNMYNKAYFYDTFKTGKPQVSNRIEVDENLEPILTLTYPIKRDKSVEAIIAGTLSYSVLKDLFTIPLFSSDSYIYIVAIDGNVILCNRDKKRSLYNVNLFDLINNTFKTESDTFVSKMKSDMIKNRADFITFSGNDAKKLFSYMPLGINNWYILSVIPYSYILKQQFAISILVYAILGIIIFTVLMFICVVYTLFRMASTIEKDNERLTIATNQNQTLIFELDLQKNEIVFSGDTNFILGTDRKNFPLDFIRNEYYKRIHHDDLIVMTEFRNTIEKKGGTFSGEFRYKTLQNDYIWLKISSTLIKDEDEKEIKIIGTLTNVNSQVLHEQELKSIAELDKLTGLLNKTSMESHAKQILQTNTEQRCALFIVDLDNFKKVNDMLGHLVGDMAITDAAKKLSLVFSEKDLISRFGGDEFCILLRLKNRFDEDTIKRIITEKAQNMCTFLREDYFDEKSVVSVSASIGISLFPDHGASYEEIFKKADEALYTVKNSGKNGFKIFE